ncbi:SLAM family member 7-like isoform X2 [Chamaea fasciata]|uniref:SLAM family member 7-like isoform X2 n=1 Tax=Chamaea fasciata TaxID=190680 RepID=UPI00336AC793
MEEFWLRLLALLALLTRTCSASDPTEVTGAVGGSVTFRSNGTDGNAAFWSFGNDHIVTVAFKDPSQPIFAKEYEARFAVSEDGWALSISQLRMEDAGTYSVKIDGKTSTFTLRVYKELTEPTVTCETQNCSGGRCRISLRCSVPGAGFGNVSYTWRARDGQWERQSVVLAVNQSSQEEPEPLTCAARNAVSSRSVTVASPGGLCSGAFSHSGAGIGITAGIAAAVGVSVAFVVFFCKSKGWKKFHLSQSSPTNTATTECTTVYAEVGLSQQRIPNGIKSKPTAGESSSTIYSLVKRPEQVENATVTGLELV